MTVEGQRVRTPNHVTKSEMLTNCKPCTIHSETGDNFLLTGLIEFEKPVFESVIVVVKSNFVSRLQAVRRYERSDSQTSDCSRRVSPSKKRTASCVEMNVPVRGLFLEKDVGRADLEENERKNHSKLHV